MQAVWRKEEEKGTFLLNATDETFTEGKERSHSWVSDGLT
jgi:hypothetical protein